MICVGGKVLVNGRKKSDLYPLGALVQCCPVELALLCCVLSLCSGCLGFWLKHKFQVITKRKIGGSIQSACQISFGKNTRWPKLLSKSSMGV